MVSALFVPIKINSLGTANLFRAWLVKTEVYSLERLWNWLMVGQRYPRIKSRMGFLSLNSQEEVYKIGNEVKYNSFNNFKTAIEAIQQL